MDQPVDRWNELCELDGSRFTCKRNSLPPRLKNSPYLRTDLTGNELGLWLSRAETGPSAGWISSNLLTPDARWFLAALS